MKSRLKASLYLGLAALSLGAVATATTTADAASKPATIVSKSALGKASKNVEVTGTNAIYTKPGTVKGAKKVASKKLVKELASSTHSKDYFRAYHMAVTSRGTVYYKIVSMNGKYRGYIYGGKVKGTLAGGIREAQTVKTALTPSKTPKFHLANAHKNGLWEAPKYTQYKAKKVSLYGVNATDTFTVSKAETKAKEGTLYYYVTDDQNPSVSGWIYAGKGYVAGATTQDLGGLSLGVAADEATENNSVTVNYLAPNGNSVGKSTFIGTSKTTKKGDKVGDQKNVDNHNLGAFISDSKNNPSGYSVVKGSGDDNTLLFGDQTLTDAVKNAVFGGTVNVHVYQSATSKVAFYMPSKDGVTAGPAINTSSFLNGKPAVNSTLIKNLSGNITDKVVTGEGNTAQTVTDGMFNTILGAKTLVKQETKVYNTADDQGNIKLEDANTETVKAGTDAQPAYYYVAYAYDKAATARANADVKFGSEIKAVFQEVKISEKLAKNFNTSSDSTTNY